MAERPGFLAELVVMVREAVNDMRGSLIESYFGRPEHISEPGTPMSPTPQMVTRELDGRSYESMLDDVASRRSPAKEQQRERE